MEHKQQVAASEDKHQDTEGLWPRSGRGFVIGQVDEINGLGGEECDGFRPTRYELRELARLWYRKRLDLEIDFFLYGQSGSTEWRESVYADRRLERIASVIGDDAVGEIVQELEEAEKKRLGDELWDAFASGDPDRWQKVQQQVWAAYAQTPSEEATAASTTDNKQEGV